MPSTEQLLRSPAALCNMIRRVAVEAGQITLDYFDGEIANDVFEKEDGSPVTLADRESEKFINAALRDLTPEIPIVAEEAIGDGISLASSEYFWLVDPLDATREFVAGGENFTVNIALAHNNKPVMGVVFAPALGILYAGYESKAIRWNQETGKDKDIRVRIPPAAGLTVMSSQNHANDSEMHKLLERFKVEKILKRASSLKICMVAEGRADLYPRFGLTSEWDTAAGEAVLRAAGGFLTDMEGKPLIYGKAEQRFVNPHFIASSFVWKDNPDSD